MHCQFIGWTINLQFSIYYFLNGKNIAILKSFVAALIAPLSAHASLTLSKGWKVNENYYGCISAAGINLPAGG